MKTQHQKRIEEFMRHAEQELPEKPILPAEDIRKFRATLILEEALETIEGLGFGVGGEGGKLELIPGKKPSLVEIVDGCADISVVTIGTLSACGVHDQDVLEMVDQNNLAKFGPGSYRRKDGKWMKPPGHTPPDITWVLKNQGYENA